MIARKTMTPEEWDEMNYLRKAISHLPSTVVPEQMEKFSKLLVKSLENADDSHPLTRN
jgi:hypothetical protein